MAVDMFLKLDGIEGESGDAKHKKEIDVLAWSWGASQSGSSHTGSGSGSGKVSIQDLSITKYVDSSSHKLLLDCCNGGHIKTGTLYVRKAGVTPLEYIKITMEKIIISSISSGGSGGEDRLTENISLNFAKFKYEYTPQKPDGSGDAVKETGWDIVGNEKA
ncbi:type VI secretion system tube protein Hcp [Variovorax sp. RKNM96]|uniref:Hcp family type VI secretion system effector n=1 Tax=Variovorax sp. RKNM96 TaxID=2681552 RepID=UPI0019825851|nr:type VI secretion system tube protein Hcp [Variovorax sp. RKNM96]QSI28641.1 type VI secretion system tube protein Hcp [Variovorax sp. RKNM96]